MRINAPKLACRATLFGAYASKRPFAHPQRIPVARSTIAGSTLPACLFSARRSFPRARPTHDSSASSGWPRIRRSRHHAPVARFSLPRLLRPPSLHSPRRIFGPPRIATFNSTGRRKAHLDELPDFPSLPACLLVFSEPPADQRSRFATAHQVRLLHEPLGTLVIMLLRADSVK